MKTPALLFAAALIASLPACGDSARSPSPSSVASVGIMESRPAASRFALSDWHPINKNVSVSSDNSTGALLVSYRRKRGAAAGVALKLSDGASEWETLSLHAAATPDQRLYVCLTDTGGVVWSFPPIRAKSEAASFTLAFADLKPDPFQNQGKALPAAPDLSAMTMITILDISGFMGAPEVACEWTLHTIEGAAR